MDIIIAFLLLVIAVAVWRGKPIKVEVTHQMKYPEAPAPSTLKDPNETYSDHEVKDAIADVVSTLNDIMTGGDLSGADSK